MSGVNEPGAGLSSSWAAPPTQADGLPEKDAAMADKSMKLGGSNEANERDARSIMIEGKKSDRLAG